MKKSLTIKQVIIVFTILIAVLLGLTYLYITVTKEKNLLNSIVKHSQEEVKRLQIVREYYTKFIINDIEKSTKNIKFSFEHKNSSDTLPFPTTVIHDLTTMYSSRSDVKIEFYSEYPFKNRKDRVLTTFQKEAIIGVKNAKDGVFSKKDVINGKKVFRVAVGDYMILPACVNCHNTHKLKDWPNNKWKLGDKRGIIEVITPID